MANIALPIGARRYAAMMTDMALSAIGCGAPVRETIQSCLYEVMRDQATVCDTVMQDAMARGGADLARWYDETLSSLVRVVRPAIGVETEVPIMAAGEAAAEGEA